MTAGEGTSPLTTYDVGRVRAWFPGIREELARFDSPGGSLVAGQVADAVHAAMTSGLNQRGTLHEHERAAESVVQECRAALGDLLGTDPTGVVLGRSATALVMQLAATLARGWGPGDEVVVCRLDHDSNIRPWVIAAERAGATVRWLGIDPVTAEVDDVEPLLTDRTRLVAVTGASNLVGTRPDVAAIAAAAHAVGALVHVDAVHLTPHAPVDRPALGADLITCSPYKFFGPHLGALAADPALLETLRPDKLLPSSDAVPERFELGTLPYELLAGTTAAVDVIADLVPTSGSRRERVVASMTALAAYEAGLLAHLLDGLAALPHVTVHGSPAKRTPTVLLTVAGVANAQVSEDLAEHGVVAPHSSFYALEASRALGLGDAGGVRVGLAAYTTRDEVDRLLAGLASLD
ncbi:cysteine desulfurase-like protein [Nocardioides sp.]|uniref:cysteine desulfurase-like protein n=1 Tax=Nocardioides sp. TaxID=35761 RepID=UPI00261608AF|nr:cysteine desulfurase-like protein [Nocardioides sp.]